MSEPMTSVEIEDVLASIRRLVSEDLRPAPTAARAPSQLATDGVGKLILTPAHRVQAEPAPTAEVLRLTLVETARDVEARGDRLANQQPDLPRMDAPGEASLGSMVSQLGARVDADDWDAEAPYSDTDWTEGAGWDEAEAPAEAMATPAPEVAEVVPFVLAQERRLQAAWRDGAWADGRADVIEFRDEPLVADPAAPEVEPEIELAEAAQPEIEPGEDVLDVAPPELPVEPEGAAPPEMAEAVSFEEAVVPVEEAAFDATVEDDEQEDSLVETAVAAEVEEHIIARTMDEAPRIFAPGDADDFDEEALREVVRDIIRDELHGALGERITRSVRKLVRAEIQRMLITRDIG